MLLQQNFSGMQQINDQNIYTLADQYNPDVNTVHQDVDREDILEDIIQCPICAQLFESELIEEHVEECMTENEGELDHNVYSGSS